MSIVKCEECEQDIDLDKEDVDYSSEKGWLHIDCKGIQDLTDREIEEEITHIEHADIMQPWEKRRLKQLKKERDRR